MKKVIIIILSVAFINSFARAQQGLENILVEKYYVSNAADAAGSVGTLPAGSVTYRVYADMLPGYEFQAAYGINTHELKIGTTTSFFNNQDRGATTPAYTKTQATGNTVMLDSWLSVGAACSGNFGVLKSEDGPAGGSNVVNANGLLQNADPSAGIPLTVSDGFYAGTPEPVQVVGLTSPTLAVFNNVSQIGNSFSTTNGSWAALNGAQGPNPSTNKVLIGQFTTNGTFSFELNIQIGTPTGGHQNYVAKNPTGAEIQLKSLIYPPDSLYVRAFIQGYYVGAHKMTPVLFNQSVPGANDTQVDSLTITLHQPSDFSVADSYTGIVDTGGHVAGAIKTAVLGNSYYIGVKHRNGLFTVSANPVTLSHITSYDFTGSAASAFGSNEVDALGENTWSIYSGDISADEYIATDDVTLADNDNLLGLSGSYLATDVGGDGYCGTDDVTIVDNNNLIGIFSAHP